MRNVIFWPLDVRTLSFETVYQTHRRHIDIKHYHNTVPSQRLTNSTRVLQLHLMQYQ